MGVLCEIFIAPSDKEALLYDYDLDHVESHRVYTDDFARILAVLRGKKFSKTIVKQFKLIGEYEEDDTGPWFEKIPADFPELLVGLSSAQLTTVCKEWNSTYDSVATSPYELSSRSNREILSSRRAFLVKVRNLCKRAIKTNQKMYLWTSL